MNTLISHERSTDNNELEIDIQPSTVCKIETKIELISNS